MKDNNKGFSGLEGLSTNIDDILEEAAQNDKKEEEKSSENSSNGSNKTGKSDEENKNKSGSLIGLLVSAGAIFFILWAISSSNIKVQKSNPPPQYKSTDAALQSSTNSTQNQTIAPRESEKKSDAPKAEDVYKEEKPPISSNNILTMSQLRYCQAEKIRIDTSVLYINRYSEEDIASYNAYISDYNSRCPQSRYYEKDMNKVNKEIADRRHSIEQEGKERFIAPDTKPSNVSVAPNTEQLFTLTVSVTPSDATIKILNIGPKYQHGISLKKGSYLIEITKSGYQTVSKRINLEKNENLHINLTKDISIESDNQSAKAPNQTTQLSTKQTNSYKLPANAKLNYYGDDWECKKGFRKSGNECLAVKLPANAKLNYYGDDWECEKGFRKSGNECLAVKLPANAKLNYYGDDWECKKGFRKSGNECLAVKLPANAKLNYYGDDWECEKGFRKSGNECLAVKLPANAKLNYYGDDWECEKGFRKSGNECLAVKLPANAKVNYYGDDWECKKGFRKSGNECLAVGVTQ